MAHEEFTADLLVDWTRAALADLAEARAEIDRLNVFPVPDGDTGTNMYLTLEAAVVAAEEAAAAAGVTANHGGNDAEHLVPLAQAMARGALLGARGNSGVILSQILRGLLHVDPDAPSQESPGTVLAEALAGAAAMAYAAVRRPLEGTMLTVMRVASEDAAVAAATAGSLADVATAAAEGGQRALEQTPELLPVLKEAGVVDSGGRGITVLLDALQAVVTGVARPPRPPKIDVAPPEHRPHPDYDGPGYEVMFLLEAQHDEVAVMRDALDALGDSLVVVGGEGLWNVHVHVNDAGAAVEAGMRAGRPYRIRITWLREAATGSGRGRTGRVLVAVAHGDGVADVLASDGVLSVRARPGVSPSTAEFLDLVNSSGASEAILLPGSKDVIPTAEAAAQRARKAGIRTAVVPTRAIVQSLAAVAVHDEERGFDDDVTAMARAAGATRYGAVTVSSKKAMTSAGLCEPGDVLGLIGGDIVIIGTDVSDVARRVVRRMVGSDGELVTLLRGADMSEADLDSLIEDIEDEHGDVDVMALPGGQRLWPLIIGVE